MGELTARLATPVTADDHVQGPPDARVTLLQYGDYECPYTRMSRHSIHALQREYADNLRFVFRHFPLEEIHPHARGAATAAEAAEAQGQFWAMHDYLFEHQNALADRELHHYAIELGLEPDRFERDRTSPDVSSRIDRDVSSGELSGVQGTPTFYVNGVRHDGTFDVDVLRAAITGAMTGEARGIR
jgi:protein-disulfide isomerase